MNKIKETKVAPPAEPVKPSQQQKRARKFIKTLNVFGYIDKQAIQRFMPFMFFMTLVAVAYIANSYMAERIVRNIDKAQKDIKEMRAEYISAKTELMIKSKQTEVASAVLPFGLKESTVAPKKIVVNGEHQLNKHK